MKIKILISKLYHLPFADKVLLVRIVLLAGVVRAGTFFMPYKSIVAWLVRFNKKNMSNANLSRVERFRILIIVMERLRFLIVLNCLSVSTAFWYLMKKEGIITHMKFGMKKDGSKLLAHAWLEYNGDPLTADELVRTKYISFDEPIL